MYVRAEQACAGMTFAHMSDISNANSIFVMRLAPMIRRTFYHLRETKNTKQGRLQNRHLLCDYRFYVVREK